MFHNRRRLGAVRVPFVASAAGYTAQGVHFNGSTYMTASALTGLVDGQKGILAFWFKFTGNDGVYQIIMESRSFSIGLSRDPSGHFGFTLNNTSAGVALNWTGVTAYTSSMSNWVHILAAWDLSSGGVTSLYVNDSPVTPPSTSGTATIDYLTPDTNFDFGARSGGSLPVHMDMADYYFNTVEFLDFTTTANRRKFISASLAPVDLGATGSLPTTNAPMVFFRGPVASWHTNKGTGGGFTLTGTLTASATNPP